jgi:S-adenosylmethionine synthetase
LTVNTFDTSNVKENVIKDFVNKFDMKPGAIIERLNLINVNYRIDTLFSHFGHDDRNWEKIENI